jgi:hypothetical protein
MKRIVAIIVACISFVACIKPGDVTLPPYEPRLVLHGYIAEGDTFRIALGKTLKLDALKPEKDTYVSNGWVLLYENDVFLDSLKYKPAEFRYVSNRVIAVPGKTYKVRAGAPGFPDIEATTTAPLPVATVAVSHTKNTRHTAGGTPLDDVKFSFNDPANESNFYLTALYGTGGSGCVYTYDPSIEKYAMNLVPFEEGDCIDNDQIMFTDKSFNGTLKEIVLSTSSNTLEPLVDPGTGTIYRPYLRRYHITEEYYRYYKTAINQDQIFEEGPILTDPRTAKGNVKNGYGLFTVFAAVTDTIR